MFDLSGYTKYKRTTHHPDGRSKFISTAQDVLWKKHWPVGNMIPIKDFANVEYIHNHVVDYVISAKLTKYVSLEETKEILAELAGAGLAEVKVDISWPV